MRCLIDGLCRFWNNMVGGTSGSPESTKESAAPPETKSGEDKPASPAEEVEPTQPVSEEPPETVEPEAVSPETEPQKDPDSADDLTLLRGIGEATQNRLRLAGIRTFAQLADAGPGDVRKALGDALRGAKVDDWIAEARKRASSG